MDAEKQWAQQFHLGALRNTNSRAMQLLGPDSGYDSMGDFEMAKPLAAFFDALEMEGKLAKTILYVVNPRDNEMTIFVACCATCWVPMRKTVNCPMT